MKAFLFGATKKMFIFVKIFCKHYENNNYISQSSNGF